MTNPSADVLNRYRAGTCTPDEKRQVDAWYDSFGHEPTLADAHPETTEPGYQARLFQKIQASIAGAKAKVVPLEPARPVWLYAVAASLAGTFLLAGLWWQRTPATLSAKSTAAITRRSPISDVQFTNRQSKISRYALPDGSVVWLNPRAKITHPARFNDSIRAVSFVGEGFFNVQKDARHPFIIRSGRMTTEVLGTSFNVRANPASDRYEVAVVTGKVAVSMQAATRAIARRVLLEPQQQALVNVASATIETHQTLLGAKPALYEPISIAFDWVPLDEVARRLEAVYAIKIELGNEALRNCRLRADFTNEQLPVILDLIGKSVNATYAIEGKTITLTGAGCPE